MNLRNNWLALQDLEGNGRMKLIARLLIAIVISSVLTPTFLAHADTCTPIGSPTLADDGLTVSVNSMSTVEKTGSFTLTISYSLRNATPDKKIDEGSFKLYFKDGSSEPQYGFFGTFFPGDSRDRSYTWEYLKNKEVRAISYNAGFFSQNIDPKKLNWVIPGQPCSLSTPTPTPTPSRSPSPSPSSTVSNNQSSNSAALQAVEIAIEKVDLANLSTDAANKSAEAADTIAQIKSEFALFEAQIAQAVKIKNIALLPAFNQSLVDSRINSLILRISDLESFKKKLDIKDSIYSSKSSIVGYKELMLDTAKIRGRVQSTITQYIEAINNLKIMQPILEKSKMSIESSLNSSPAKKDITIVCVKGKSSLKVTGAKPLCPSGYKKK